MIATADARSRIKSSVGSCQRAQLKAVSHGEPGSFSSLSGMLCFSGNSQLVFGPLILTVG